MTFEAVGINHKTAPLSLREQLALPGDSAVQLLSEFREKDWVKEGFILSTCNRVEFYLHEPKKDLFKEFIQLKNQPLNSYMPHIYRYENKEAITHLMRVASGLDSMLTGETEIFGQIKSAYKEHVTAGCIGKILEPLFQYSFSVVKHVRHDTFISQNPLSVAHASVQLAKQLFSHLEKARVLLIGAGQTIQTVAKYLKSYGVRHFNITNRSKERGMALADELDGAFFSLNEFKLILHESDIIIAATDSENALVSYADIKKAIRQRKRQPMFIVDIAVPRDVDAKVAELSDAYLYTIDDLDKIVQNNRNMRLKEASKADKIILDEVEEYMRLLSTQEMTQTLTSFRRKHEYLRDELVQKALLEIERGTEMSEIIKRLGYNLTNKFLHAPTVRMKGVEGLKKAEIINHIQYLFDLEES